jgi:hypothetical protein
MKATMDRWLASKMHDANQIAMVKRMRCSNAARKSCRVWTIQETKPRRYKPH